MYGTVERLTDRLSADTDRRTPSANRERVALLRRQACSSAPGIAVYFLGVVVESAGLGIIAAYGSVLGALVTISGIAIGLVGNRLWPDPQGTHVSRRLLLKDSVSFRGALTGARRGALTCGRRV